MMIERFRMWLAVRLTLLADWIEPYDEEPLSPFMDGLMSKAILARDAAGTVSIPYIVSLTSPDVDAGDHVRKAKT